MTAGQVPDGPMTGERVRGCVTAVPVPALRPGDTAVLDNRPRPDAAGVRAAVEAAGCRLMLLPPYGPDPNPIELAFAELKPALRTAGHRHVPELMAFLRTAGALLRADECRAYSRHCGYGEPATPPPNPH